MNGNWLYGWKSISQYIGCSSQSLKKYSTEYELPIHRLPNGKPFAIPHELDQWGSKVRVGRNRSKGK
jgi:hypothetical protein